MKPETARLREEFVEVIFRGHELAASVDDGGLMRRPAPESWSVAENLEHLSATAETFARRIRRRLDSAVAQEVTGDEKRSLVARIWLWLVEPPSRLRLKVPAAALQPGAIESRDSLLARFEETHRLLIALLDESDGYDRMRLRIPTPFAKRISVSMLDSFAVLAAHGRRHLWQAERARVIRSGPVQ